MKPPTSNPGRRPSAGTTLVEALITFLVLSLGLLAVSRVQGQLRLAGDTARQRSEAVRLADEDLEQLRSSAYADIVPAQRTIDTASGHLGPTVYRLSRQVAASTVGSASDVSVAVTWIDRAGAAQTVRLETVVAASDPALSGALGIAPETGGVNGPSLRSIGIPPTARNLGDGRSAWRPAVGSSSVLLFDNASGLVAARCQAIGDGAQPTSAAGFTGCSPTLAFLLTGVVRFATAASAESLDPVRRATIGVRLSGNGDAAPADCETAAVATADGDRYLAYSCVIDPPPSGRWSGESRLVPVGWSLDGTVGPAGSGPGLQICREGESSGTPAADRREGGLLAHYSDIGQTLINQNFRVIARDAACRT